MNEFYLFPAKFGSEVADIPDQDHCAAGDSMRVAVALPIVAFALLPAGCRWLAAPHFGSPKPEPTDLPLTERQIPAPDASAISDLQPPQPPAGYYQLTADECHTLACRNSAVANLIESSVVVHPGSFANLTGRAYVDWVRVSTATHLSREARNRTAAAALTLYYRLLELELKADILQSSVNELDALVRTNEVLIQKGFKETGDTYELKRQRIELLGEQAKLRSGIQRLNAELKSFLAIDPGTKGFLLPADQVRVVPDPLDPDVAVQAGLMLRADLNLIRYLANAVDYRSVPAVRHALIGLTPVLGAVMPGGSEGGPLVPFVSSMAKAEAGAVKRQLHGLLRDREREAAKDIRTAVEEWSTARDLVAIARKKFDLGQERMTDLEKRQKVGQGVEMELRKARLALLQAEADLVSEIAKWKLADVKAREAIGLLCGECN